MPLAMVHISPKIIRSRLALMAPRAGLFLSRHAFNVGIAILGMAFCYGFFWALGNRDACVEAIASFFRVNNAKGDRYSSADLRMSSIFFWMGSLFSLMLFSILHQWLLRISGRIKKRSARLAESQQPELDELRAQSESIDLSRATGCSDGATKKPARRI